MLTVYIKVLSLNSSATRLSGSALVSYALIINSLCSALELYPGVYPVHPFSTVITGLIQAGGVDTTGSLRNIEIKRDGKRYSSIDLYSYFLAGEIPEKIQLRDQDIVIVHVRNSTITIDEAVVIPGKYVPIPFIKEINPFRSKTIYIMS